MFFGFRVIHFIFLAGFITTAPVFAYSPQVPTEKYSQLFLARFYPWYIQQFSPDSNLNKKQQQTLKQILKEQKDYIQKIQGTYINTFAVGYLNTPEYTGPSLRVLRSSPAFGKEIEALTGHKAPGMAENILMRGFEVHGGKIFYVNVIEVKSALTLVSFTPEGKSWQQVMKLTLNEKAQTELPPFLKTSYQSDNTLKGETWFHTTEFVDEKYLNLPSQKVITSVRNKFNLEPSLIYFKDSAHYGFYFP